MWDGDGFQKIEEIRDSRSSLRFSQPHLDLSDVWDTSAPRKVK